MLFNKNNVRKVNDKKVLHKVGKNWKVVSLALLLAIGGTAAATHVNANADANSNTYRNIAGSEYYPGNNTPTPQPIHHNAKANTNNNVINFKLGYAGSAAKNNSLANSASDAIANNASVVNSYVGSINSNFSGSVTSYKNAINSGSNASSGDNSLANSYSAVANNDNTKNLISNLASKASSNPTDFVNSVANTMSGFSDAAKGAKANSAMVNLASSLVNKVGNITSAQANESYVAANDAAQVANNASNDASSEYQNMSSVATDDGNDVTADTNASTTAVNDLANASEASVNANNNLGIANRNLSSVAAYVANSNSGNVGSVSNVLSSLASSFASNGSNSSLGNLFTTASNVTGNQSISVQSAGLPNGTTPQSVSSVAASEAYAIASDEALSMVAKNASSYAAKKSSAATSNLDKDVARSNADAKKLVNYKNASSAANTNSEVAAAQSVIASAVSAGVGNNSASAYSFAESLLSNGVANDFNSLVADAGLNVAANGSTYGPEITGISNYDNALNYALGSTNAKKDYSHYIKDTLSGYENGKKASDVEAKINAVATALQNVYNTLKGINNTVNTKPSDNAPLMNGSNQINGKKWSNPSGTATALSGDIQYVSSHEVEVVSGRMSYLINYLKTQDFTGTNDNTVNGIVGSILKDHVNVYGSDLSDFAGSSSKNLSVLLPLINRTIGDVKIVANKAGSITDNATHTNGFEYHPSTQDTNATKSALATALGKDGVNFNSLNASSDSNAIASVATDFTNESGSVSSSSAYSNDDSSAQASVTFSLLANSALNNSSAASSAASSYAVANDVNSVLASSYANSYSNAAKSEGNVAKTASNGLNQLYFDKAGNPVFNDAFNAYNANEGKVNNYRNLAYANGMHVFNYGPKYINVIKKCAIHTNANYGENGDHKLINVPAGAQRLPVIGVGITYDGSFVYKTIYRGYKGFITNLPEYVKPAYLFAGDQGHDVNVLVTRSNTAYSTPNFAKGSYVGGVKAGQTIHNADVISMDNMIGGFTRLAFNYKGNTYYTTTNTDYVKLMGKTNNNNNPKPNNNSHHSQVNPDNGPVDFL